jgi:hypothetical protein
MDAFIGSVWFALLVGVIGFGVGVWLCKTKKLNF